MPAESNQDVRDYIATLTQAELTTLIAELRSDFAVPETVEFAEIWKLGASDHEHQISMSTADFESLRNGGTVVKTTWTTAGHEHLVTLTYAAGVVSITIADNHTGNLHDLQKSDGGDVVTQYVPAA